MPTSCLPLPPLKQRTKTRLDKSSFCTGETYKRGLQRSEPLASHCKPLQATALRAIFPGGLGRSSAEARPTLGLRLA